MLVISDKAVCGVFVRMYVCMSSAHPFVCIIIIGLGHQTQARYSVAFPFLRWGIFLPMGTEDFRKFPTSLIFF